jgi:hypothetical protein
MPSKTQPYDSRNAIITALIGFGLFALVVKFYPTSSSPASLPADLAPPPTASLIEITSEGAFDFSKLGIDFNFDVGDEPSSLERNIAGTSRIRTDELIQRLVHEDTSQAVDRDRIRPEFLTVLNRVVPEESVFETALKIKQAAESLLVALGPAGAQPSYNRSSQTLSALIKSGTWQGSSGTLIYHLVALRQLPRSILDQNLVQIFERGHVLPGFMRWRNGEWQLYGLEMTVRGGGLKIYGPTASLGSRGFALRIVAAPESLIAAAFANDSTNAEAVALKILNETATRYGFSLRELEGNLQATGATKLSAQPNEYIPRSRVRAPWAFGEALAPTGNHPFPFVNQIPLIDNLVPNTEIMAVQIATKTLTILLEDSAEDPDRNPRP